VSTLFVCVTCRREGDSSDEPRPGARLFAALKQRAAAAEDRALDALESDAIQIDVMPVECLSNCQRACTAALSAPGKWTYVVGELDPDRHVDDMLAFARLHDASSDGLTAWRERPAHVRKNTIARVPPLNLSKELS